MNTRILSGEQKELLEQFRLEVCLNSKAVDPDEERYWYDLSIGWFLAKGMTINQATDLALEARYTRQYWC